MKIVVVSEWCGSHLGESLAAECLKYALLKRLPDAKIVECDLAALSAPEGRRRRLHATGKKAASLLPRSARQRVQSALGEAHVRRSLLPYFRTQMQSADAVVFAGGALFSDAAVERPIMLAGAAAAARDVDAPIAVYGASVDRYWSQNSARLFREAFDAADIVSASVSNALSRKRWDRHFASVEIPSPALGAEPCVLAARAFATTPAPERKSRRVGLCVAAPKSLQRAFDGDEWIDPAIDAEVHRDLARRLIARGFEVFAFSDGDAADEAFLQRCFGRLARVGADRSRLVVSPRLCSPAEFATAIAGCDALVSARLHANVVAWSCGVPSVGLSLNRTLDEFMESVGRGDLVVRAEELDASRMADRVETALSRPIDAEERRQVLDDAERDVARLGDALEKALARRRGAPPVQPPALEIVRNA